MKVRVIGSADAFNSAGRCHSCYWLEDAGSAPMMVDFGGTALQALKRQGLDSAALQAVVLTHLHGDHFGGLPFLVIDGLFSSIRSQRLHLVGPVGLSLRLRTLLETFYGEASYLDRLPHQLTEVAPGQSVEVLGAKVQGFLASHQDPPELPLCLRITGRDGKVVAFSGDTELCDGLFSAGDGADLLIAECSALAPPAGRHCTWSGWQSAFDRVRAKRLVLTHLDAGVRGASFELARLAPLQLGLAFADDGMVIEV